MAEKTSLERSHSKASNAKLTFLCIVSILTVSLFFIALAYALFKLETILFVITGAVLVLVILEMLAFNKFKR